MASTKTILLNTGATYIRTLLSAGLTLFSSRWVIQALGVSDFGLFSLVGSTIVFIIFFNNIMSSSASRHFAFALGRNIKDETNNWFNTALSVHLLLPILLIIIGYPLGVYLLNNVFEIPVNKVDDSVKILKISLLTAFVSMVSVPFIAMYIAKQKLIELAIIGFFQSILTFIAAYFLLTIPGNKLIIHTILIASSQILIFSIQIFRAFYFFPECKINVSQWFNKQRFLELSSFAFWNMLGNFGHLMLTQGLAFVTNLFFGTKGNAAYGISNQLSTQTSSLTNALSASINPEIIRSEGKGETQRAINLSFQSTKLGIYLMLLLTIPMLIEIKYVLNIWLNVVPENAELLCKLMIIVFMLEKTTMTHITLLQAINKISKAQLFQGLIFTSSVAVAVILIKLNFGIGGIGWAIIITMVLSRLNLVFWVNKYLNVSARRWVTTILLPYAAIVFISGFSAKVLTVIMHPGLFRLFISYGLNLFLVSILFWMLFLSKEEKALLKMKFRVLFLNKIR